LTQADNKVLSILFIIYDPAFFNPPEDDVVEGSGSIESCLARHKTSFRVSDGAVVFSIAQLFNLINNVPHLTDLTTAYISASRLNFKKQIIKDFHIVVNALGFFAAMKSQGVVRGDVST
jgi:hypothetical protein